MTSEQAIAIAREFIGDFDAPRGGGFPLDPTPRYVHLAPIEPELIPNFSDRPGSEHAPMKWHVTFTMRLPDDMVQSPSSVLVLVDPVRGFAESYPLL